MDYQLIREITFRIPQCMRSQPTNVKEGQIERQRDRHYINTAYTGESSAVHQEFYDDVLYKSIYLVIIYLSYLVSYIHYTYMLIAHYYNRHCVSCGI